MNIFRLLTMQSAKALKIARGIDETDLVVQAEEIAANKQLSQEGRNFKVLPSIQLNLDIKSLPFGLNPSQVKHPLYMAAFE